MWQELKNYYHLISAVMAAFYYGFPGKKLKVIGVTGTDGKTTTTHLIQHILKAAHKKSSMISSIFAEISGDTYETGFHVTSPNEWMLQNFLKKALIAGDEFMVLEVTSHALDQYRVWGINFVIGVLTNITHEHFDYHKTFLNYLKTKEKLLKHAEVAVINKDDSSYKFLNRKSFKDIVTYAIGESADITPNNFKFESPLPGEYNKYNSLAAVAACRILGIDDETIKKGLLSFKGVKGRFEEIKLLKDTRIIIDFAHTPNAIDKVLSTIKPDVSGKLIHVFGSAALRDHLKRPIMGEKSAVYADLIVLTEEDYRTENVDEIIDEIAQGCLKRGAVEMTSDAFTKALTKKVPVFFRIPNRQKAIEFALQKLAHKGDTVILTGKAHEGSLARGTVEYPWSEHEAVNIALGRNNDNSKKRYSLI